MHPIQPVLKIEHPQDALAAVPHLLGFRPHDSLVVLVVQEGKVVVTLRVDLPPVHHRRLLAANLVHTVRGLDATDVLLLVFDAGPVVPPASALPHAGLIAVVKESMHSAGVQTTLTAWAASADAGAPWCSYEDPDWNGTLPDPNTTEFAAAMVAAGYVTFADREEFAAQVAPVADDILLRRKDLLDDGPAWSPDAPVAFRLVRDAVTATADRRTRLGDHDVVQLARALSHHRVRDACLSFSVGDTAEAAELLWLELTRGCPIPERAEPATLLAFSAYLRGDGALASVALEQAAAALPGHRLSNLLRTALDAGTPPERIAGLVRRAAAHAGSLLADDAEGPSV